MHGSLRRRSADPCRNVAAVPELLGCIPIAATQPGQHRHLPLKPPTASPAQNWLIATVVLGLLDPLAHARARRDQRLLVPGVEGKFLSQGDAGTRVLRFYSEHFSTVEVNNTFYRTPTAKLLAGWASEVPAHFAFAVKAPQRITHIAKLKDATETVGVFVRTVRDLGSRLGPLLFQLPPSLRKDVPRLTEFLEQLPADVRVAFEFRHASWFDDEVWSALRRHGAALCVAEGEALESPLAATTDWGYVRLRRDDYPDAILEEWAKRIRAQPWGDVFVYLKHDAGNAPSFAKRLVDMMTVPHA